jgi:hypothetical protein
VTMDGLLERRTSELRPNGLLRSSVQEKPAPQQGGGRPENWWCRLRSKPRGVDSPPVSQKNTEREVHPWVAEETGATEAPRSVAAVGDVEQEPGVGTRDARTWEAPGEEARTKKDTGRGSTSASTGWPNGWSDSKKRCTSCAAAVTGGAPGALRNRGCDRRSPGPTSLVIDPSAWKGSPANFALMAVYEAHWHIVSADRVAEGIPGILIRWRVNNCRRR